MGDIEKSDDNSGCWTIAGFLFVGFLIIRGCDSNNEDPVDLPMAERSELETKKTDNETVSSAESIDNTVRINPAISQATVDARKVIESLQSEGVKIYSENCYASLESKFTNSKLERCLAFDLIVTDQLSNLSATYPWFEISEVRARFVAAGSEAGLSFNELSDQFQAVERSVETSQD